MKTQPYRILFALAVAGAALALAPNADADAAIKITVLGIKDKQGFVMISLHDEKGWSGAPIARARIAVTATTLTTTMTAPAAGRYGLKMFHDVDGDGKMNTNIVGLPTEPIGFSNDAPIRFGAPDFAAAGFEVGAAGASHTVTLK